LGSGGESINFGSDLHADHSGCQCDCDFFRPYYRANVLFCMLQSVPIQCSVITVLVYFTCMHLLLTHCTNLNAASQRCTLYHILSSLYCGTKFTLVAADAVGKDKNEGLAICYSSMNISEIHDLQSF